MNEGAERLWRRWGDVFAERTRSLGQGRVFSVREVFTSEWNTEIAGGERGMLGQAIRQAVRGADGQGVLAHIEEVGGSEIGNSKVKYRRL